MTDRYEIAAKVALAGLDGFVGVLSAAKQREVFGRAVFGRKYMHVDASGQGRVWGIGRVCFGTDTMYYSKTFGEIAELANNPKAIPTF